VRTRFLNSKTGFTLVEVLVALFIIALVILGGGMFFFYGRVNIVREAHRRAAVLVASQRLEELRAAGYWNLTPEGFPDPLGNFYYIVWNEATGSWDTMQDPSYEHVMVDNLANQEMVTKAGQRDNNGDGNYDHLEVIATVEWTDGSKHTVTLVSLIAGPG